MKTFIRGLCLLFAFNVTATYAQHTAKGDTLIQHLTKINQEVPKEKVHLHIDRSFYAAGDTVWFAGYIVNAIKNMPTELSRIVYVDLIDGQEKLIRSLKLPVRNGFSSGQFDLADSLPQGIYHIRAYTNWMRNSDQDYFFNTNITVLNPPRTSVKKPVDLDKRAIQKLTTAVTKRRYQVGFFPEGGKLINGIQSIVTFKGLDDRGASIALTGKLIDESGDTIVKFSSRHAGTGTFMLTPVYGKSYNALMLFPDGTEEILSLPKIEQSGYVLSADNSNTDSLFVHIRSTKDLVKNANMIFLPLSNGVPLFYMKTDVPDEQVSITIPKNKLPGGIIQLSLLNDLYQPVSERLIFNRYKDAMYVNVAAQVSTSEEGAGTVLELLVTDALGKPVIGSFSVAMVKPGELGAPKDDEQNIFSDLLLTSDLKGYIEQPSYYFSNFSSIKDAELDDLMRCQTWTKPLWKDPVGSSFVKGEHAAEQNIKIIGRIEPTVKSAPVSNIPVTLLAGDLRNGLLLDTLTNDHGSFSFNLPDSLGNLPIRIEAKPKKPDFYKIILDLQDAPPVTSHLSIAQAKQELDERLASNKNYQSYRAGVAVSGSEKFSFNSVNQLKDVKIRDYNPKPKLVNSHSANLNGPGQADRIILAETIEKLPNLTLLDALLPVKQDGAAGYRLNTSAPGMSHEPGILVLVDGVEGLRDVRDVNTSDIESIELLKDIGYIGIYGIRGSGGVLLITTKKGKAKRVEDMVSPNLRVLPSIFSLQKQFSQTSVDPINASGLMSATLFWKADVITDKNGRAKIVLKRSGNFTNAKIIIEGISSKGNLGRQILDFPERGSVQMN